MILLEGFRQEVVDFMNCVYKDLELRGKLNDSWDITLKILADNLQTYYEAAEIVAEEGLVITGGRGAMCHPAEKVRETLQIRIEKAVQELGISPKSLKYIEKEEVDEDDVLYNLMN